MKKVIFGIAAIALGVLVVIRIESVNKNITYPEIGPMSRFSAS